MKKTDIAMLVLIAGISVLVSYTIVNSLPFFQDANKSVSVKTAEKIDPEIKAVDESFAKIFSDNAINPTVEVVIGAGDQASPADQSESSNGQ